MNYQELLETDEWRYYSSKILERDKFRCQICYKRGFKRHLYIPITSIDDVFEIFKEYRFGSKSFQDVINIPGGDSKKFYFKPFYKCNNLFCPNIEFDPRWTKYQYAVEIFRHEDIYLYCDHPLHEKVIFHSELLLLEPISDKNDNILNNSYASFSITRFQRTSNIETGYIKINDFKNQQNISVITNEFCILIELSSVCLKLFPVLNVHHTFYYNGNTVPWGYYWKDLVTLCEDCHHHLHEKEEIPIYDDNMCKINNELKMCDRCGGSGFLPQYNHVENGICFKCRGTKKIFMK